MHQNNDKSTKVVIYYNASDIFLGITLLVLVVFFIYNYVSNALTPKNTNNINTNQVYKNKNGASSLPVPKI